MALKRANSQIETLQEQLRSKQSKVAVDFKNGINLTKKVKGGQMIK